MHLNMVNPGHNNKNSILVSRQRRITATYLLLKDITKRYYSNLLVTKRYESIKPYGPTFPENWSGTLLLIIKVMNDNAGYLCVLSSVISLDCLGTTKNTYQFDIRPSNVDQAIYGLPNPTDPSTARFIFSLKLS